jgi:hypothetical protein
MPEKERKKPKKKERKTPTPHICPERLSRALFPLIASPGRCIMGGFFCF